MQTQTLESQISDYLERLQKDIPLDRYVERRFDANDSASGMRSEFDYRFRRILRDRDPDLTEILKHSTVIILGEPGSGKSVVAKATALKLAKTRERLPVLLELRSYRGSLETFAHEVVPPALLKEELPGGLTRFYILDGLDEIPSEFLNTFTAELPKFLSSDPKAGILLTSRQAFYVANRIMLGAIGSIFHVLDFNDEDIRRFVELSGLDADRFLETVESADARSVSEN
jgi:predicted NACHT family NTPase